MSKKMIAGFIHALSPIFQLLSTFPIRKLICHDFIILSANGKLAVFPFLFFPASCIMKLSTPYTFSCCLYLQKINKQPYTGGLTMIVTLTNHSLTTAQIDSIGAQLISL